MVRDSEIISNVHHSPFVVSNSDGEQPTTIQIIACSHHSKVTNLLPLVDFAQYRDISDVDDSHVERSDEKNQKLHAEGFGGEEICVVGSSLDFSDVHFPIGSGPLFSFGMRNEERSDFNSANFRINTKLTSSSLLNVTSQRTPFSENGNRFGSLMRQDVVGCCVTHCSNHDSGTTMLDVNVGGDLHSLNTSFSSCIRQSNAEDSYANEDYTQGQRFDYPTTSTITSSTFTSCTFKEMTAALTVHDGGSAISIRSATSLTITQCSFHICNLTNQNDDGGAIFVYPPNSNTNTLTVEMTSFTECKTIGNISNCGGSIFASRPQSVLITDSFFEKGEAHLDSAVNVYFQSTSTISNCSFVDCKALKRGTIGFYNDVTISTLAYLFFRGCSAPEVPGSKDVFFQTLTNAEVSSKITNCDSTSGSPNVYFQATDTSDSTLVPQLTSTPTVNACSVRFSGNEATVIVRTKEVIGGTMGILLEGCLVPRMVFVRFDTNGENSTIGAATVSSGANGILPSATYSLRSFVLPGDVGSQLFSASATLKDANTTRITVNGVTLLEGSYSMLVQSTGSPINISLSRTNSATLTGDAPLYPSSAIGRLDWLTQYTIIKVERVKSGTVSEVRRTNTLTFTTPSEPARIIGIWVELESSGNTTSITLRGRQMAKGSYTVTLNSESGPSFEVSFPDDLSDERNSSISSVSIFGELPVLSFNTIYTLFSVTPISSPSDHLLIDADPNYFVIAEPARVISTFPVLSSDLQTVTISLTGRAFNFTSFTTQLQVTSPTTSSPFTTTATRMSNEELTLTLPILSGTPSLTFGDEITILSLKNGSVDVILDCSTILIPHPPKVTSAECRFVNSLHTTITIELNGTDLPLHTPFLVTLDSGDDFEITFDSTLKGSTAEMAVGWPDSLQYSRTYRIVSIMNEVTSQAVFVEDPVTFSIGPAPSPIIVFCDSSSSDSSRFCGTSERACSSMDSAWKMGRVTGSLDVSIRIKQNASLSNTVSCVAGGVVVVEKGTFVEPTLRIPWSAWMGEKGMIVVSSDGLFELRDVDVVIESTLPSFVFLFASHSTLIIKDGSFVGPSDSTPSTDNDEDDSDSSVCSWETGIIQLENCSTRIDNTKFSSLQQGAINMKDGNLSIQTSAFSDNTPSPDLASGARRNIRCSDEGSVDIKTLSGGDGLTENPSPWMSIENCSLTGGAAKTQSPLFVPSLESGSKSILNKSSKSFTVTICGDSLFPCDLSLEVFEMQKNKAEGKSQLVDLTAESTTSFTESTITLSLSQSQLDLEASLEWRGRLVFGNGARTNSSFVIQQNTADRFAQSVKDNMKWWIPLVVALSTALIVFIFVVVCCLRRQSKKKKDDKLLDPKTSEMDGLPPEKIEIVEDWKYNLPHDSLLGAVQSEGNFSKADTSNDHQHTWISAQETKETGQAESCVDGVVMLEGDAMQLKPVNRQDTLFNRLHSTPKIPLAKLQTAKQIARALTELQKVSPLFTLLSCLSSHFVLFDSNGNVELRLTDGKEGKQADLIQGAQDPPIQPQPLAPVPFHALNHHHISHLIQSELNTLTLTTQPSQESSSGEGFELLRWRAPEATANVGEPAKEFDHGKAAVFSLGLILFEIESETVPLSEMDAVNANRHLGTGHLPKMELIQNDGLFELITSCLSLDPSLRPNLDSIESKLDSVEFSNPDHQKVDSSPTKPDLFIKSDKG
ncbi:hypothetical protein BLNAU_8679 [Blattamonas nauphoetae]|uniref:Serine-threonine/tyrosine-protein kinase catalytic domain-containing protein n=1 Tax=Blattamonas nauphoetae TaxID=2049346 RepID=A0ABQ9XXT9_9EUKA|nr:hypothetical protein BLNAU_8679 [Blattamonas nauphoetae]